MSLNNQQMVLQTIDTTSQRIKAGNLEVLAWIEYWMLSPRESKIHSDSVSMQFLGCLKCLARELRIESLFRENQVVAAATFLDEPIPDRTWGAVDLVEKDSSCFVAVFNNGGLTDIEQEQLIAALSTMREFSNLNDTISWLAWGKYNTIRAMFKKFRIKQLGR